MYVEIDMTVMLNQKLTPTQYFTLFLLADGQFKLLQTWLESMDDREVLYQELRQLIERELLINESSGDTIDFKQLKVSPEFIETLDKSPDTLFDKLIEKYPIKTIRSDGTKDYLRTDLTRCRRIYHRITNGNVSKHSHIMSCLDFELKIRHKEGSMEYMKRLPKWLASEEWLTYEQRMTDEPTINMEEQTYGTKLV